jgi:hypothetical protein
VVIGSSSVAQSVPQRQHAFSWRAIGAWHERHRRGKCRSRISQRSLICDRGDGVSWAGFESGFPTG